MPLFVFRFGYETSQVTAANEEHGWDDEFSEFVVIDAPDEEMASAWGCEVAERFVQTLGGKSWRAGTRRTSGSARGRPVGHERSFGG